MILRVYGKAATRKQSQSNGFPILNSLKTFKAIVPLNKI